MLAVVVAVKAVLTTPDVTNLFLNAPGAQCSRPAGQHLQMCCQEIPCSGWLLLLGGHASCDSCGSFRAQPLDDMDDQVEVEHAAGGLSVAVRLLLFGPWVGLTRERSRNIKIINGTRARTPNTSQHPTLGHTSIDKIYNLILDIDPYS